MLGEKFSQSYPKGILKGISHNKIHDCRAGASELKFEYFHLAIPSTQGWIQQRVMGSDDPLPELYQGSQKNDVMV